MIRARKLRSERQRTKGEGQRGDHLALLDSSLGIVNESFIRFLPEVLAFFGALRYFFVGTR